MDMQYAYEMLENIACDNTIPEEFSEYAASCIGGGKIFSELMPIAQDMTKLNSCGDIPESAADFILSVLLVPSLALK